MKVTLRLGVSAVIAMTICGIGTLDRCRAQDTDYLNALKIIYGFDEWAGRTKVNYDRLVTNWVPDFASIGVTNFLWRLEKEGRYGFHPSDHPEQTIDLRIVEGADVINAHLAMIEFFTFCEALQPFPLGSSRGVDIGDRCYVGYLGDSAIPSLAFVRNNVFVDVSSESGDYSVLRLAERLDSELMARSFIRPFLFEPALSNGTFLVSVATVATQTCILEYSDSLIAPNWTALPPVAGDGTVKVLVDPAANPRQRYYRMVQPTAGR